MQFKSHVRSLTQASIMTQSFAPQQVHWKCSAGVCGWVQQWERQHLGAGGGSSAVQARVAGERGRPAAQHPVPRADTLRGGSAADHSWAPAAEEEAHRPSPGPSSYISQYALIPTPNQTILSACHRWIPMRIMMNQSYKICTRAQCQVAGALVP